MQVRSKQQLPTKWLVAIVGVLILYGLTQPILAGRFGWPLPSLAKLLGQDDSGDEKSVEPRQEPSSPNATPGNQGTGNQGTGNQGTGNQGTGNQSPGQPANSETSETELLYGLLVEKRKGSEDYSSLAGLRYTKGSEEGHRLKHLQRHLEDQPSRPGKHGVFYGDLPQVLRWLDDAYKRGNAGAKGAKKRQDNGMTIYEVSFDKPVGYVGGRDGGRDGNPDAKKIRMVVDGDRLITAFPF